VNRAQLDDCQRQKVCLLRPLAHRAHEPQILNKRFTTERESDGIADRKRRFERAIKDRIEAIFSPYALTCARTSDHLVAPGRVQSH
jgi:hypothetical protein